MKRLITSVTPKAGNTGPKEVGVPKLMTGKDELKPIDPSLESPVSTFRTWRPLQKKINKYEVEEASTGDTQDTEDETVRDSDTLTVRDSDTLVTDFRTALDSNTYETTDDDISKKYFEDETSLTDCSMSTYSSSSQSCTSDDLSESSSNSLLENTMPKKKSKRNKNVKEEEKDLRAKHQEACTALKSGKLRESMKVFKEILNKLTTRYGNRHLRIGTALHNVGVANLRAGNYGEAADAIEEAVLIRKKKLGKTHPKVADSLVELGTVLLSQREFVDAIEILSEALKIREGEEANVTEEEKGNVVIQQSKIINNIGCVHFEVGDMEKAKEFFERALKIQREGYANGWISSDPAYVAMSSIACNLGFVHIDRSEWQLAIEQLEEALKIQQSILDSHNKMVFLSIESLAFALVKSENYDRSHKIYMRLLEIEEEKFGQCKLDLVGTMLKVVYVRIRLFKFDAAMDMLEDIEYIQEKKLTKCSRKLLRTKELINSCQYQLDKKTGLMEAMVRALAHAGFRNPWNEDLLCRCGFDIDSDELDIRSCMPKRPNMVTKLSGHRISYA